MVPERQVKTAALGADDGLPGIRFLHVATADNTSLNSTYIDHPLLNDDPNAIVIITKNANAGGSFGGTINERVIGVWYDSVPGKWAIFNQDGATMAVGTDYNILIPDPSAPGVFVHTATAGNTSTNHTLIDNPLTNNNPDALLFITQNWNPGNGSGIYNDHPVGVWYDDISNKWSIFNEDGAAMPAGADFNVLVAGPDAEAFVHVATAESFISGSTLIDYPPINDDTHALLFVTQNWNPGGAGGIYNPYTVEVYYNPLYERWGISSLEPGMTVPVTEGAAFNVLVVLENSPSFTHGATAGNTSGHVTQLIHPRMDEQPDIVALITQNWNPGGIGGTYNDHPPGLWYSTVQEEWRIFNQGFATMPLNAAFNVYVPNMDAGVFVHKATAANNHVGYATLLEHPLTDNDPDAIAFITQNWNPGGVGGTYNPHPVSLWYVDAEDQWVIFNTDSAAMPEGASFNVFVPLPGPNVFVHEATAANRVLNWTYLDHPLLNNNPHARILVTQNWNPGGGVGITNNKEVGVWYDNGEDRWAIFNQDESTMPEAASFNVFVIASKVYLPLVIRG
ncbi:MAG: hypothetical protein ACLFU8_11385 [Anaerolineales bacterium]